MKRHNARILAVMIIFDLDMNQAFKEIDEEHLLEELVQTRQSVLDLILDDEYRVEIDEEYSSKITSFALKNYEKIINLISSILTNWTIDRLSYVDRAIIICAGAEMLSRLAPKEVIINEYLEITKEYSMVENNKQVKFNNALLDNLGKKIYE